MPVTYKGITTIYGWKPVGLFEVSTLGGPVYMSCSPSLGMDNRAVVIVDAERFTQLWRGDTYEPHLPLSRGHIESWKADYKYKDAEAGFIEGASNPVPLATISFGTRAYARFLGIPHLNHIDYVSFTNGITRTIWLLCNDADSFPVEVSADGADGLFKAAGVADHSPFIPKEMFHGIGTDSVVRQQGESMRFVDSNFLGN